MGTPDKPEENLDLSNDPDYRQIAADVDNASPLAPPDTDEGEDDEPDEPPAPRTPAFARAPVQGQVMPPQDKPKTVTIMDTGETNILNPAVYLQMKALANDFIESGALSACWNSAAAVLVGLQTGIEMGMKPMEAMNSLYFVKGAINIWGKATVRRLKEHGYSVKYENESQESCTAIVSKGREKYKETYTFDEAEASGYTNDGRGGLKVGWRPGMNRKLKLRYGVLALIIKSYIPEVLGPAVGIVEVDEDATTVAALPAGETPAQRKVRKALESSTQDIKQTEAKAVA